MTFTELLRKDFEIKGGKIYIKNGDYTWFDVRRFGWGEPKEYYIEGAGIYSKYYIKQDAYNDWYIYDGYSPIKKLNYLGGETWLSYF